jgi:hypothetical protein
LGDTQFPATRTYHHFVNFISPGTDARGTEGIPRFQPSAAALGAATAQQILDELRKKLADVDLKKSAPGKRARKKS